MSILRLSLVHMHAFLSLNHIIILEVHIIIVMEYGSTLYNNDIATVTLCYNIIVSS